MSFHFQQRRGRGRHHSISRIGSEDIEPRWKKGREEGRKVFIPSVLDWLPGGASDPGCQGVCPLQEDELSICSLFPARKCPCVSPCKDRMTLLGTHYVLQALILTKRKEDLAKMEMSTGPWSQKAFLGKLSGWTDWLLGPSSEPASEQEMVTAYPRSLVPCWCNYFGEKRTWRTVGPWRRSNSNVNEWMWKKQPGNQKCWSRVSPSTGSSELLLTGSPLWPLGCVEQLGVPTARYSSTSLWIELHQACLFHPSSVLHGHRLCLFHLKNFWSLGPVTLLPIPQA